MIAADDNAVCLETVRVHDRDRYLASLLIPEPYRAAVVVLYAFNAEIARVRDVVSEPIPGEIRLQWWRDAISDKTGGDAPANPVLRALLSVIDHHDLNRETFDKMLLARAFDLYNDPMPSMTDLEGYAGETSSLLFQLAAFVCGEKPSRHLADACGHAGVAYALTGLMRNIGRHAGRGQLYLPADILQQCDAKSQQILNGEMHDSLGEVIAIMLLHIKDHLHKARSAGHELSRETQSVFLPLALIKPYLKKIEKPGFNPFTDPVTISQLRAQWTLWRAR